MCNPVALAGAQFAGSAAGQIGQFQQQRAQARATNRARLNQYNNQIAMRGLKYDTDRAAYNARISDYKGTRFENRDAYALSQADAQGQLNETYGQAAAQDLQAGLTAAAASGRTATRGVTGRSAALQQQSIMGAYGRSQSQMMDNLLRARFAYGRTSDRLRNQLKSADRQAYNKIGPAPMPGMAPPKPVFQEGPSGLALVGNLAASAAGSAISAHGMSNASNGGSWFDWKVNG